MVWFDEYIGGVSVYVSVCVFIGFLGFIMAFDMALLR